MEDKKSISERRASSCKVVKKRPGREPLPETETGSGGRRQKRVQNCASTRGERPRVFLLNHKHSQLFAPFSPRFTRHVWQYPGPLSPHFPLSAGLHRRNICASSGSRLFRRLQVDECSWAHGTCTRPRISYISILPSSLASRPWTKLDKDDAQRLRFMGTA